ncbi:MAG: hypothetical protein NTU88_02010 [Armatimonadetes bacterium]|nr:hypothetical protein [Armatimonadota bacterium]
MTTEVQIGQNRIHLLHLRKVISRIAPLAGLRVEITGPSGDPADPPDTGHGADPLATVRRLVDRAEVSRENGSCSIRMVKCARKANGRSVKSPAYLAAAGSTSLQS